MQSLASSFHALTISRPTSPLREVRLYGLVKQIPLLPRPKAAPSIMRLLHPSLDPPPMLAAGLPSRTAHLLSLLFTSSYVGSIYISQLFSSRARRSSLRSKQLPLPPISSTDTDAVPEVTSEHTGQPEPGSRDHPDTIRARMKAVGLATLGSLVGTWWTVREIGKYGPADTTWYTLKLLGLGLPLTLALPQEGGQLCLSYLLAPVLFLGPIYVKYLESALPMQRPSPGGLLRRMQRWWSDLGLVEIRNYVVGPLTEELVFRSTIISVCVLARLPPWSLVFGTPLWFGIAHFHHAYEAWKRGGRTFEALVQAIATSLVQLTYTTLFGWFASYLFIRTGSVLPPLASHIFCNYMGLSLPGHAMRRHPSRKLSITAAYLGGIGMFILGLRAL